MVEAANHIGANVGVAMIMVVLTVIIHFFGMIGLSFLLARTVDDKAKPGRQIVERFLLILASVLGVFCLLAIEIHIYAILYRFTLGIFDSYEVALYFSTQNFVALGYGDMLLAKEWRLLGAIEAINGLLLIGWSTAFLISVMGRIRALEHEWLHHRRDD
jgi:Ion channel